MNYSDMSYVTVFMVTFIIRLKIKIIKTPKLSYLIIILNVANIRLHLDLVVLIFSLNLMQLPYSI